MLRRHCGERILSSMAKELDRLDDVTWEEEFDDPIREYAHFAIESR